MKYTPKCSWPLISSRGIPLPIGKIAGGTTLIAALLLGALCPLRATEYFVGPKGDDNSAGVEASPFHTIQHAVDVSKAGDTVTVLDGEYKEAVLINHSGDKDAPITIRSKNHWGAKVIASPKQQDCFSVGSRDVAVPTVAYITIQGFDLRAAFTYGSGVATYAKAHHITVENVYAHDCGSSGIGFCDGDYWVARNNVCAYNAFHMPYCGSGISMYGRVAPDDAPGFHNIVSGNVCYGNDNAPKTMQTDGNGIIIDDRRDKQKYHNKDAAFDPNYQGDATLVENNLCFHNGGKGIIIYSTNNVTVVNNTCVRNMRRANQGGKDCGEISISCVTHVVLANNIAITSTKTDDPANHPNVSAYSFLKKNGKEYPDDSTMQGTVTAQNNLSFDENKPGDPSIYEETGLAVPFAGQNGNLAGADPSLINPDDASMWAAKVPPDTNFAAYFGLQQKSPAIASGIKVDGSSFADQKVVDLGAFQQSAVAVR
jgi:parallel beta-helix repeat protein